jgi:hypothetical protein
LPSIPQSSPGHGCAYRRSNSEHDDQRHRERLPIDRHENGHQQDADGKQWQEDKEGNCNSRAAWLPAEEPQPTQHY